MKYLLPAILFFVIGIVIMTITMKKYKKAKGENEDVNIKPFILPFAAMIVMFVVSQIFLILCK